MKKVLSGLFKQPKSEESAPPPSTSLAAPPPTAHEFVGKQQAYVIVVSFPEFKDLAGFLTPESRQKFLSDFDSAIGNSVGKLVRVVKVADSGVASVALQDSAKQTPNVVMKALDGLHGEIRSWVGTFGRTGIPTLKYGIGVSRGEVTISKHDPRLVGPAWTDASEISLSFCPSFDVRIGVSGDVVRGSTEAVNWLDMDDWQFETTETAKEGASPKKRVTRLYSLFADRLDADDVQMVRAARKAYFLQNWDEAHAKFDRLTMLPKFRHVANLYLNRIQHLRTRPKDPHWDGVYRL